MRTSLFALAMAAGSFALIGSVAIGATAAPGRVAAPPPAPAPTAAPSSTATPAPTPAPAATPAPTASGTEVAPLPPASASATVAPSAVPVGPPPPAAESAAPVAAPPMAYNWNLPVPAPAPEAPAKPSQPWTTRDLSRNFWQLTLGVRNSWITHEGFDPFATTDSLTQVSISGTRTLVVAGDVSLAAGLSLEGGSRSATARGAPSDIYVLRPGAVLEGRYHLHNNVYASLKLVPHAARVAASIDEPSAAGTLEQVDWRFGMDATAGVAWNFVRTLGANPVPGWWLWTDFGYGFTQSKDIVLKANADESSAGSRHQLSLGTLAVNGLLLRVGAAVTF